MVVKFLLRIFLPSLLVLDTNFVLGLRNTHHLDLLGKLKDLVLRAGLELYVPSGVYAEAKDFGEHLASMLTGFSRVVKVDRDESFEEIRGFAVRNGYLSSDEYVDVEVISLAARLKAEGSVGIVTFDEGIIKTVRGFPGLRGVEVVYPWSFLLRLVPFADPTTRDELKNVILDVYKYFYGHRVVGKREVFDLVEDLVEGSIVAMELSGEVFLGLRGDFLFAVDKYLSGEDLSPQDKVLVKEITPLLDVVKLVNSAETLEQLENRLADTTSTLIILGRQLGPGKMGQLLRLASLLTSKSRFKLVTGLVERGETNKAIMHLDLLRYLHVQHFGEEQPDFLSKIHTLMSLLCFLEGKYGQSSKYLDVARKIAALDLYGKITHLLLCLATDNVGEAEKALAGLGDQDTPIFGLLINLVHDLILRRHYETAAKLLISTRKCKDSDDDLIGEKALILLKFGEGLDLDLRRKLEELVPKDMLKDHTPKPLDKKLVGKNIPVDKLHPTLKNKMIVMECLRLPDKVFLVVWSQTLKSRLGITLPKSLEEAVRGAMTINIVGGVVSRVKLPTPQEKSQYDVRSIIELSPKTRIETEKWKIPIK